MVGCISDSSKASRDYIVNIDKPTSLALDSIVATRIVDADTVQYRFYDSTYTTSIKNDSVTTITLNFDFQESSNQNVLFSYVCYSEGIVVLTSESSFDSGGGAAPPVVHKDSLLIRALKEYGAKSVDNDSINTVLFDSLFISYMLSTPDDSTNKFYNAYKKKSGADTVQFIGYVLDTLKGRTANDSNALAQLKSVLPPNIDILFIVGDVIINSPIKERLTFEGLFTAHVGAVQFVELQLTGDLITEPIVKQAAIDVENSGFKGFIDLTDLGVMYSIKVLVYDADSVLTGWYAKDFTTLALAVTLPPFDAWNAKPWLSIDPFVNGSIDDTVPVMIHVGDSVDGEQLLTIEMQYGDRGYTLVDDTLVQIPLPSDSTADYSVKFRVTDIQGNTFKDSISFIVYQDVPEIILSATIDTVDKNDSLFFNWVGSDTFGTVVYEFKALHDPYWMDLNTAVSVGVGSLDTTGLVGFELKAIDDDSNVVFDTAYVAIVMDVPVVSITSDTLVMKETAVLLNASISQKIGTVVEYVWYFSGDVIRENSSATTSEATWTFNEAGSYIVVLQVTDDDGNVGMAEQHITVINSPPIMVNQQVKLSRSAMIDTVFYTVAYEDANLDSVTFSIESGNDEGMFSIDVVSGALKLAENVSDAAFDMYTLTVQVDDGDSAVTAEVTIQFSGKFSFVDIRDGQSYLGVKIGTQTWMAENLNYSGGSGGIKTYDVGFCPGKNYANEDHSDSTTCDDVGRGYRWSEAMSIDRVNDTIDFGADSSLIIQGICPVGWHLPSQKEFEELRTFVDSANGGIVDDAYISLKAEQGWGNFSDGSSGNGTDAFGFKALPAAVFTYNETVTGWGTSDNAAQWWSSSEGGSKMSEYAHLLVCNETWCQGDEDLVVGYGWFEKRSTMYVRCLMD